ncbi:hybrid sensor histidine kinase/response regulator [Holophaga foetida]|uniref:hybrid sensor histidine kinase/response regulator n=1 Tax=Holophaga foetida TaxID=35839 RepID=UPI0002471749|nr:ATP-binding protein [Holophaga foetida]
MEDENSKGIPAETAERTLRETEEKYRTLEHLFHLFLEYSPIYFFFKDAELRPILLSRNFEQMVGKPMDQILGRTMEELFPPELAKSMIEDDRRILQEGALVRVDEALGGKHFTTIKFPVKQEGRPTFLAGLTIDVTDQKNAEEALRRSEAKFRSLFDSMIEGVAIHEVIYDSEGKSIDYRILDVNPAYETQTGLKADHSKGRLASEIYGGEGPPYLDKFVSMAAGGAPLAFDAYFAPMDRHFHICAFSLQPGAFATVFEDITERKRSEEERCRLEAEFQHMQQLDSLGSLAGGVAHDMNNVLQAIQGMTSVLKVKCAEDPGLASGLDLILSACTRGGDLVKNLTDFARKGLQQPSFLDLNQVVRNEVEMLQHTTLQRIELQTELDATLPQVLGDSSSIGNALMNLCINAIDAMPERGVLRFRTRRLGDGCAELSVEDSGQGIAPEVLAHVTEPFFTTKPKGKGTGLGLSGVYGTMKAHGGSMDIQSEVGKGTRVILRFPAPGSDLAPATLSPLAAPSGSACVRSLRIQLIDDDELIRETFPEFMEILGHRVLATAEDGSSGLRQIEEGLEVDVVVLDHNMPGLSGVETLTRLRSLRPGLPIVFCSGHLEDAVRSHVTGCSLVWTLMKPYGIKDIQVLLGEVAGTLWVPSQGSGQSS